MATKPDGSAVVRQRQELPTLTSYSDTVFLLSSRILFVDSSTRTPVELLPATEDAEGSVLRCEHPQFQFPLKEVLPRLSALFQTSGASIGRTFSEPTPVFEVNFDSQGHIRKMLGCLRSGSLRDGMKSIILPSAQGAWKQASPDAEEPVWEVDIDLDLLQVLPDTDEKDAIVLRVTPENCSDCVHHWNDRKVFDVGSVLTRYRNQSFSLGTPACREVELLDLIRALREVTGWMQLGILLRVPKPALDKIYSQCHTQGEDMCKIEMLSTWLNSRTEVPTWDEVVSAVSEMGNKRVASRIASKYGITLAAANDIDRKTGSPAKVKPRMGRGHRSSTNDATESLRKQTEETHIAMENLDIEDQLCTKKKRKLENHIVETQQNYDIVQQYTGLLTETLKEKEMEIKSLQTQQLQYQHTIRDLEVKLTKANARAKQKSSLLKWKQKRDLEDRQKETERLQKRIAKKTAQLDFAKTKLEAVKNELDQKTSQLESVSAQLLKAQYELETKNTELDEVKHKLQEIKNQRDVLKTLLNLQETALEEAALHEWEVQTQLKFQNWNPCESMPIAMSNAKAVLLDGRVYIGGGVTKKVEDQYTILVYTPESDEWSQLPPCPVRCFAMAIVNHQLVLAGGLERDEQKCSNKLSVWDSMSKKWTHPFPAMPTARCFASAVGYESYAVVAGGDQSVFCSSDIVEVLDTLELKWYTAQPAPIAFSQMTTAIIGRTLYLLGGCTKTFGIPQVLRTSLRALIHQAISSGPTPTSPEVTPLWQQLPRSPLTFSTAVVVRTSLLAFGGYSQEADKRSCCILLYEPEGEHFNSLFRRSTHWMTVKDTYMPCRLSCATCIMLPSGHILLLGGYVSNNTHSEKVYKVSCECTYD